MKKTLLLLVLLCCALSARAQVWTDAASLPLFGKAVEETASRYSRLPAALADVCWPPVWRLG